MNVSTTIEKICGEFLAEARNSPTLLADMAAMEKYMAESYSSRIMIELLQNADDAGSDKVLVTQYNDSLIVANNGRLFTEADIVAISRSGSSQKKRGETIGYRGVGFKSTSFLSNDIIIYSGGVKFTFSKSKTAIALSTDVDKVPTIRIPFLYDECGYDGICRVLSEKGYKTIFVFAKADTSLVEDELGRLSDDFMLFLRNINYIEIAVKGKKILTVTRKSQQWGTEIQGGKNKWAMLAGSSIVLAIENGQLAKTNSDDSCFYCFLPTYDKVLFPIKANADFSTDPSRKHIILDDRSCLALDSIGKQLSKIVYQALATPIRFFQNTLEILSESLSFSQINIYLKEKFDSEVLNGKIELGNGEKVPIKEYKIFTSDFDNSIVAYLRKESAYVKAHGMSDEVYRNINCVDTFISHYSDSFFECTDIIAVLSDILFVQKTNEYIYSYLLGKIIIGWYHERMIHSRYLNAKGICLKTSNGVLPVWQSDCANIRRVIDCNENNMQITESMLQSFVENLNVPYVLKENALSELIKKDSNGYSFQSNSKSNVSGVERTDKPVIHEWDSPEEICCAIERFYGNNPQNVSWMNSGYAIESTAPDGTIRYIAVKSVNKADYTFCLTNDEYNAAYIYGVQYYICIVCKENGNTKAVYIKDPINTVHFEKQIREWEWFCEKYQGVEIKL